MKYVALLERVAVLTNLNQESELSNLDKYAQIDHRITSPPVSRSHGQQQHCNGIVD